jgi:hypothetical protein
LWVTDGDALIGQGNGRIWTRVDNELDRDLDPVRRVASRVKVEGVSEGVRSASGTETGQERLGWLWSVFLFNPRFAYFRLSLSFAFVPLFDLLLISSVNTMYISLPTHIPPSLNQFPSNSAFTIQILFLFRSCLRYTWMDEAL